MFQRLLPLTILIALASSVAYAAGSDAAWKQLLSLAGEWEGTAEGKTGTVTYTVISGGTALMESMKSSGTEPGMVTIYHRDGDGLMATHYCSMGNQPRMRASGLSADGKSIPFRFADITNLKPAGGHIKDLTVTFEDPNHFTQEWTSFFDGKEQQAVFKWTRKR
jgi:hypothetical protein